MWLTDDKIPQKITPCPIVEAILEIKFEPKVHHEAVFGMIYPLFSSKYKKFESLPILQIPQQIRDRELFDKPHYKAEDEHYVFSIGPRVISLCNKKDYIGWSIFSKEIKECLSALKKLPLIKTYKRMGLRYINYFEGNVYQKINLGVQINNEPLGGNEIYLRNIFNVDDMKVLLQISNSVTIQSHHIKAKGSIVDIDVSVEKDKIDEDAMLNGLTETMHEIEKRVFFSLLKKEFLETLNPQ